MEWKHRSITIHKKAIKDYMPDILRAWAFTERSKINSIVLLLVGYAMENLEQSKAGSVELPAHRQFYPWGASPENPMHKTGIPLPMIQKGLKIAHKIWPISMGMSINKRITFLFYWALDDLRENKRENLPIPEYCRVRIGSAID